MIDAACDHVVMSVAPSPRFSGRLAPGPFVLSAIAVYALGFLSQTLLAPPVTSRLGVVPFVLVQAALIAGWIVVHRLRLRDAGRPLGIVTGIAAIYVLELVLLTIVVGLMLASGGDSGAGREATLLNVFVILYLLTLLSSDPQLGAVQIWVAVIVGLLALPAIIALGFSVWTATRPSITSAVP